MISETSIRNCLYNYRVKKFVCTWDTPFAIRILNRLCIYQISCCTNLESSFEFTEIRKASTWWYSRTGAISYHAFDCKIYNTFQLSRKSVKIYFALLALLEKWGVSYNSCRRYNGISKLYTCMFQFIGKLFCCTELRNLPRADSLTITTNIIKKKKLSVIKFKSTVQIWGHSILYLWWDDRGSFPIRGSFAGLYSCTPRVWVIVKLLFWVHCN